MRPPTTHVTTGRSGNTEEPTIEIMSPALRMPILSNLAQVAAGLLDADPSPPDAVQPLIAATASCDRRPGSRPTVPLRCCPTGDSMTTAEHRDRRPGRSLLPTPAEVC